MTSKEQELQATDPFKAQKPQDEAVKPINHHHAALEQLAHLVDEAAHLSGESKSSEDSLKKILASENLLSQVKQDLANVVDAVVKDPSLITKVSKTWGEMPVWQKYSGLAVGLPFVIVGLSTLAVVPFVLGSAGVVLYTAAGLILEEHYQKTIDITDTLKKGILGLADVLTLVINALDKIRQELALEIEKFRTENEKLAQNIDRLDGQVHALSLQTELFIETETLLRKDKDDLEKSVASLNDSVGHLNTTVLSHQEGLTQTKKELDAVTKAHQGSQEQLAGKVLELKQVKTELGLELEKAKKVAATLKGTVETLSGTVIEDSKQKEAFQNRLNTFLNDKEKSFSEVADRICSTENKLSETEKALQFVKEQLKQSNSRFDSLLKEHATLLTTQGLQVERMGAIIQTHDQENQALIQLGLFQNKPNVMPSCGVDYLKGETLASV